MDGEDGKKAIEALIQHGGPVNAGAADVREANADGVRRPSNDELVHCTSLPTGNSAARATARLKRDRPDLADRVIRGELSANAAAVEAGFRGRTITLPLNPEKAARTILRHYAPEEVQRLIRALIGSD